jgi:hypothetical protein
MLSSEYLRIAVYRILILSYDSDRERMARLLANVPRRPVYQMGLLLLQRQDEDQRWLSEVVSFRSPAAPTLNDSFSSFLITTLSRLLSLLPSIWLGMLRIRLFKPLFRTLCLGFHMYRISKCLWKVSSRQSEYAINY